jgi:hypothetical protein
VVVDSRSAGFAPPVGSAVWTEPLAPHTLENVGTADQEFLLNAATKDDGVSRRSYFIAVGRLRSLRRRTESHPRPPTAWDSCPCSMPCRFDMVKTPKCRANWSGTGSGTAGRIACGLRD